ncbi:NusG domain II-containing protein [Ruminococcus flavefaciens]|uniref:NusG domain II-containing protein n=1 Tax=Ruminococcus flavefaciens TaxID=1265 RepID=UPI0013DB12DF|nr:NusG domain II-containing protein [Ruminococcus flavefaciens]
MTKGVKLLIGVVIVIFAAAVVFAIISSKPSDSTWVDIVQNNKVIYHLDLSEEKDRTFKIDYPDGGWNEVQIKDGHISIIDADCPDHTCIKTGELRSENIPIVCLPHKLVIRFSDEGAGE